MIEKDSETYCCSNSTCHDVNDVRQQIDVEWKSIVPSGVCCPYGQVLPINKKCGNKCPILSSEYSNISLSWKFLNNKFCGDIQAG